VNQAVALYHLQIIDSQSDTIRKRLKEIAEVLQQTEAAQLARAELEKAEATFHDWQKRQASLEQEGMRLRDEAASTEHRLYSGQVSNPRELVDLQDKLKELVSRREALEEPVLEAMIALDDSGRAVDVARETLQGVMADESAMLSELTSEQGVLSNELAKLTGQVELARAEVLLDQLPLYDRLRQRSGGVAVAMIRDDACGVCGVELTTQIVQQVRHSAIIICPTCGRILAI